MTSVSVPAVDWDRPLWRGLARWRHLLLLLLVVQQTWASRLPTDWGMLTSGARALTGPDALSVYVDTPFLQAGPTGLVVVRLLDLLPLGLGQAAAHLGLALLGWYLLWLVERWAHPDGVDVVGGLRTLAVGLPVLAIWSFLSGAAPHPEDGLVLLTFVWAVRSVREQRTLRAALLIGLAMSWKPWGVVALPLVLGLRRRRGAALLAIAVPAACWLPFLLAEPSTLQAVSYGFELKPESALRAFGFDGPHVPTWWRSVQLIVTAAAAALAAWRGDWLVAVAAGCAARLLLDPAGFDYYVAGLVMATALTERLAGLAPWRTALLAASFVYVQVLLPTSTAAPVRAVVLSVVLCSWLGMSVPRGLPQFGSRRRTTARRLDRRAHHE